MGNFISWLDKNLAPDSNQGSAQGTQPESAWGKLKLHRDMQNNRLVLWLTELACYVRHG